MTITAEQRTFNEFVTEPLVKLVGTPLRSVEYYALDCDLPDFDANALIASGGSQGVHLTFDGGEVEVDWGNKPGVSDPERYFAYHLMVRPRVEGQESEILHNFTPVDATEALPWTAVIGEPLLAVTVLGATLKEGRDFPQAVEFTFPSGRIFVVIGMTGATLSLGDGDEVLVFSAEQWADLLPDDFFTEERPILLWQSYSAPPE